MWKVKSDSKSVNFGEYLISLFLFISKKRASKSHFRRGTANKNKKSREKKKH